MEDIRKIVRISNKLSNILETNNLVFKKLAKFVSISGSISRFQECKQNGGDTPTCLVTEGVNRITRTLIQAAGAASIVTGSIAVTTPTGITQLIGPLCIVN